MPEWFNFTYELPNSKIEKIGIFPIFSRPFSSGSSINRAIPTMSPPSFSISSIVAAMVPPVARRSSQISTRLPFGKAS